MSSNLKQEIGNSGSARRDGRNDRRLRAHASACPKCHRQSIDLREMTTLAAPASANESEEARRSRVLEDFRRVLDAQLDECNAWESSGDLYIVYSQLIN